MSAIAVPESFEARGQEKLGAVKNRGNLPFPGSPPVHRAGDSLLHQFLRPDLGVDYIITTEKDAVRFPRLARMDIPIYFLRVEIGILSNEESFDQCINRICQPPSMIVPARRFF